MVSAGWVLLVAALAAGARGGGSLRGALEALQRRQRARMLRPDAPGLPPYLDEPYELNDRESENTPHKFIVKYINEEPLSEAYITNKIKGEREHDRAESAFRERTHAHDDGPNRERAHDDDKQNREPTHDESLERLFGERGEAGGAMGATHDARYAAMLNTLWSKFKSRRRDEAQPTVRVLERRNVQKRQYTDDDDGWGPVAFKRKRSATNGDPDETDYPSLEYPLRRDTFTYTTGERREAEADDGHTDYIAFEPLDEDVSKANDAEYAYDPVLERLPLAKRSGGGAGPQPQRRFRSGAGTDPRVLRDLSKIFGEPASDLVKMHKKRSNENEDSHESKSPQVSAAPHDHFEHHNESLGRHDESHEGHAHAQHPPTVAGGEDERSHHHQKKSIDWSQYFGIDKRKKKSASADSDYRFVKQYEDTFARELGLPSHKKVKRDFPNEAPIDESEFEINRASFAIGSERKRNAEFEGPSRLDQVDSKLAGAESRALDEALQASNEGDLDSEEVQLLKENVVSRLATAYNLEKMREALKHFKNTATSQNKSKKVNMDLEKSKEKRIAVKKEKAELKKEDILSPREAGFASNSLAEEFEGEQGAGQYLDGVTDEPFSEGYMGGSGTHRVIFLNRGEGYGECPALEQIVSACRGVDALGGGRARLFLPLCSLHHICYLCEEAAPTRCDLVFLAEADTACGADGVCSRAARAALMAMRELHEELTDRAEATDCAPCLAAAAAALRRR